MQRIFLRSLVVLNLALTPIVFSSEAQAFEDDKKGTCQSEVGTDNKYCCLTCMLVDKNCDKSEDCKPKDV